MSASASGAGLSFASGLDGTKCKKAGEARATNAGIFGCIKRGKRGLQWRLILPTSTNLPSTTTTLPSTTTTIPLGRCGSGTNGFSIALRGDGQKKFDSKAIAIDAAGNIILSGSFFGTQDFDPGPNIMNLSSVQGYMFLLKLDRRGNLIWVRQFGGQENQATYYYELSPRLALDSSGNIYMTGSFTDSADFDPGPVAAVLSPSGSPGQNNPVSNAWISKIDAAGNLVWLRQLSGSRQVWAHSITVDPSGNQIISGKFNLTVDFDPSEKNFPLTALGTPSISASWAKNGDDAFLLKLDTSGNFVWAKRYGGTSADSFGTLVTDRLGDLYVAGLGGVSKLDSSGNVKWFGSFPGTVNQSLALDPLGNLYLTGEFVGTYDLDPGVGVLNFTSRGSDVFAVKLGAAGELIWAKTYGSSTGDYPASIAVDSAGNMYSTGNYSLTLDIATLTGPVRLSSPGGTRIDLQDRYLLRLDSAGNYIWAKNLATVTPQNSGAAIAVDSSGMIHVAGALANDADLDLGPDQCKLGAADSTWIFVAKVNSLGLTN